MQMPRVGAGEGDERGEARHEAAEQQAVGERLSLLEGTLGPLGDELRLEPEQAKRAQAADDEQRADERPPAPPVPGARASEQQRGEERAIGEQADQLANR
jgi:hypothetical protein